MGRIAVADVGTNSILLLVAEAGEGLVPLCDLSRVPRLGEGLAATGDLSPAATERSLQVLREYAGVADAEGAARLAVGTQVLREARQGARFLQRAADETGWAIRVLSGEEEALYTYRGVRTGAGRSAPELLVYDIGGGSTEIIFGRGDQVLWSHSFPVGAVRLTERFLADNDPPTPAALQAAGEEVAAHLERVDWPEGRVQLVGVGGTTSTLALVHLELREYRDELVEGVRIDRGQLQGLIRRLVGVTLAERRDIPGLPAERADIIAAGALIAEGILEASGCHDTGLSGRGVRYGVAWTRLLRAREMVGW